jgi:hypothetical protein
MVVRIHRVLISPTYADGVPRRDKIPAADGVMGTIVLLAYWGGGVDCFPKNVYPEFFVEWINNDGWVTIDMEGFTDLIGEVSKALGREIGQLSIPSLQVYLTNLRAGQRANGKGEIVPIWTIFSKKSHTLTIKPRNYAEDLESGMLQRIPKDLL